MAEVGELPFYKDPKVVHITRGSTISKKPDAKHDINALFVEWHQCHEVLWKGEPVDGVLVESSIVHGSWRSTHGSQCWLVTSSAVGTSISPNWKRQVAGHDNLHIALMIA